MKFDQTPQSQAADQALNDCLSDAPADEQLDAATPDIRLARILDYQAQSLAKPDPLEACLGSSNGSLMEIGCRLAEVINAGMVGLDMAKLPQVQPALDTYLRVLRQVDRFAQLEAKFTESRRQAEEEQPPLQPTALRGYSTAAVRSKKSPMPARW